MSEEEMERKEIEEKEQDVIKELINELRQLRLAIQAHTKALYYMSSMGGRSYRSNSGRSYRRWRKRWMR